MSSLEEAIQGLPFLEKLIHVSENGELELWEDRTTPPNLSVDELHQVLNRIDGTENFKWIDRESIAGEHGQNGEDKCFKFNCQVEYGGVFEIEIKRYFVKGYFFDKNNLKGVTIQSFRED